MGVQFCWRCNLEKMDPFGVSLQTGASLCLLRGNLESNARYWPVSLPEFKFSKMESECKRFVLSQVAAG